MIQSLILGNILTFDSQINPLKFIWISLSNLFLIVLSLGLLLPWAKVRMYKYLSAMTFVTAIGNIDIFIDELNSNRSSIGEAVSEKVYVESKVPFLVFSMAMKANETPGEIELAQNSATIYSKGNTFANININNSK